jgi:AcrR family transcriptional regulator
MRKLARELGVEAMSLYNHVANKDDLVDGIVDLVVSSIRPSLGRGTSPRASP